MFTTVALSQLIKLIKDQLQAIMNINDLFAFADQLAWECPHRAILSLNYLLNIIDLNRNSIMDIIHLKVFQRLKYDVDAMVSKATFGLTHKINLRSLVDLLSNCLTDLVDLTMTSDNSCTIISLQELVPQL